LCLGEQHQVITSSSLKFCSLRFRKRRSEIEQSATDVHSPFSPHLSTQHHKTYVGDKVSLKILKNEVSLKILKPATPAKQKYTQSLFQPPLSPKK
jgi:hypothetical protein